MTPAKKALCPSYDKAAFDKLVNIDRVHSVSLGTVFHHAKQGGWSNPRRMVPAQAGGSAAGGPIDISHKGLGREAARKWGGEVLRVTETGSDLLFGRGEGWQAAPHGYVDRAMRKLTDEKTDLVFAQMRSGAIDRQVGGRMVVKLGDVALHRGAIEVMRTEPGMSVSLSDLDVDPRYIAARNCLIDMVTQRAEPFRPDVLVTKRLGGDYDPEATCPLFDKVLATAQPDPETAAFVLRVAGALLGGHGPEMQRVFLANGAGANAKSVILGALSGAFGEYAAPVEQAVLVDDGRRRESGRADASLLSLRGLRMGVVHETAEHDIMNVARMKYISGGDPIVARAPYARAPTTFVPQLGLVLVTNYLPRIYDVGHAAFRRVVVVPFMTTIPEDKQDRELPAKLRAELPGILNRILEGLRDYRRRGLDLPPEVRAATAQYKSDSDVLGEALAEIAVVDARAEVAAADLYEAYSRWCDVNGHHRLSAKRFGMQLETRGFSARRTASARMRQGLALSDDGRRFLRMRPVTRSSE